MLKLKNHRECNVKITKMKSRFSEPERLSLNIYSSPKTVATYTKAGLFPVEEVIIQKYFTESKAKLLDIGCGVGRTTLPLHEMGFNVVGIDISEAMIKKAQSVFPNLDFRVGDACNLKFPNKSFDYVLFSFNGIDSIYPEEKRIKALEEISRVLKDSGNFVFSAHNPKPFITRGMLGCILHWYWLSKFVIRNIIQRQLLSRYKIERESDGELLIYYINPFEQREQLENNGFELLEVVGGFKGRMKYFEPWLYYAAQKRG